jgi:riboflavin kinase/FMN adenylyltransferase
MQIIYFDSETKILDETVAALGNFDGVHNGHRILIEKVVLRAKQLRALSCIITFQPHTREIIQKSCVMKLTTTDEKLILFEKLGVDVCVVIPFDENFARISKIDFENEILRKKLNCIEFVSGRNQHYGNKNLHNSRKTSHFAGGKNDFRSAVIGLYGENNAIVSSTSIRKLLLEGRIDEAVNLLGHPYLITGTRIRGEHIGSVLGFPTLNFTSPLAAQKVVPPAGVYVAEVSYGQHSIKGCLYYGNCPTFGNRELHLEFFSLDEIKEDPAVGGECALWLHRFIRHDRRFNSQEELVAQIGSDVKIIKRYFFKE